MLASASVWIVKRILLRLPDALAKKLDAHKRETGASIQFVGVKAIEEYLKKQSTK